MSATMTRILLYFLFILLPSNVGGAILSTFTVECQTITLPDETTTTGSLSTEHEVCTQSTYRSPPVETGDDGMTTINSDPFYWDTFIFYSKEDEGKDLYIDEPTPIGLAIEVGRNEDENNNCYVKITTTYELDEESNLWDECTSCTYCGENAYSADCTNFPNGRIVDCELSFYDFSGTMSTIFFPLTAAAIVDYDSEVAENSNSTSSFSTISPAEGTDNTDITTNTTSTTSPTTGPPSTTELNTTTTTAPTMAPATTAPTTTTTTTSNSPMHFSSLLYRVYIGSAFGLTPFLISGL